MRHWIVGWDGSDGSEMALRWAAATASALGDLTIHLVHGLPLPPVSPYAFERDAEQIVASAEQAARARIAARAAELASTGLPVTTEVRRWLAAEALIDAVAALAEPRLLVVGQHGSRAERALLGSVSAEVTRAAASPVIVVRGSSAAAPPRRILVALDGSAHSLDAAAAVAAWFPDAELLALAVAHDDWRPEANDLARHLRNAGFASSPAVEVAEGAPAEAILDFAGRSIDLLAVGRRGRGGLAGLLLGSVADRVLRSAPCPVLVAP